MNPTWTLQDLIIRIIGEMFIHSHLTEKEMEDEAYIWKVGLTPDYIRRALDTLEVTPSSLTDALSGEVDEYLGVDRQAEREAFFSRLKHLRAEQ